MTARSSVYHGMFEQVSHDSVLGTKQSGLGVTHRCDVNHTRDGSAGAGDGTVGGAHLGPSVNTVSVLFFLNTPG